MTSDVSLPTPWPADLPAGEASEALLGLCIEAAPVGIAMFDREMRYLAASRRYCDDLGLGDARLVGRGHYEVFPEIPERWREIHRRCLAGAVERCAQDPFDRTDGRRAWLRWEIRPWRLGDGTIGGIVLFQEDITADVVAREEHRRLAEAVDRAEFGLVVIDAADNRIVYANPCYAEMVGLSRAELVGRSQLSLYARAEQGLVAERLATADRLGRISYQRDYHRPDGKVFPLQISLTSLRDASGAVRNRVASVVDASDRKRAAEALRLREALLHTILETVPDALVITSSEGRIRSFSDTAERIFGYAAEEVTGTSIATLIPLAVVSRARSIGEAFSETVLARRKSGKTFPAELHVGAIVAGGEELRTFFATDLTDIGLPQTRLNELLTALAQLSKLRSMAQMAAIFAHEVNQPLAATVNNVRAAQRYLRKDAPPEKVQDLLDNAAGEALRAGEIVRRIRHLAAGADTEKSVLDVEPLLREAVTLALVIAGEQDVTLEYVPDGNERVLVDKVQIHQVMLNLIRNAIRAMQGRSHPMLRVGAQQREPGFVEITISDNGSGIPPDQLSSIFEPFVSGGGDGMGVGLAICRTIVEEHGGRIWAVNNPDVGASFTFTLPTVEGAARAP